MILNRPINFLDIESTGTDTSKDRIITLGIRHLKLDSTSIPLFWKLNPGIPIPPESTAVHHITDEDVKNCPTFKEKANEIHNALMGCDLAGFGILNFDVPILWEEFYRAGIEWNPPMDVIDAGNIFKKKEERTLSAALKFYCGKEHVGAHGAMEDVEATMEVLGGQLKRYPDLPKHVSDLARYSRLDDRVDLSGVIIRNKDGVEVFNTKRNRGIPVKSDTGYAEWMLRADFPNQTKAVIRRILGQLSSAARAAQQHLF